MKTGECSPTIFIASKHSIDNTVLTIEESRDRDDLIRRRLIQRINVSQFNETTVVYILKRMILSHMYSIYL